MTKAEILQGVREVFVRQFLIQPQSVTRDTSAYDIDGWDSVTHVYVVLDIERRFGVKLPEQRVFELENVGELVDLVAEMRSTA